MTGRCLFCDGNPDEPNHFAHCDGRQGHVEAQTPDFDGETYERERDHDRLRRQLTRVLAAMRDQAWHTLAELERATGDPQPSISARLRDLRKDKFGGYVIERTYVSDGLWQYRLVVSVLQESR
jgi:hypothetical protein